MILIPLTFFGLLNIYNYKEIFLSKKVEYLSGMMACFSIIYIFLFLFLLYLFIKGKETDYVAFEDGMKDIIGILRKERERYDNYYFHPFYLNCFKVCIASSMLILYNYPRFLTTLYMMAFFLWLSYLSYNRPYRILVDNILVISQAFLTLLILLVFMVLISKY